MGSTGHGSFTDYSKRKPIDPQDTSGGSSGKDRCKQAFESELQEVSRCSYFVATKKVPPTKTVVRVVFNGLRLAVETKKGDELGYLPTRFNYLKTCIDAGQHYEGTVNASSLKPTPHIRVDIVPL